MQVKHARNTEVQERSNIDGFYMMFICAWWNWLTVVISMTNPHFPKEQLSRGFTNMIIKSHVVMLQKHQDRMTLQSELRIARRVSMISMVEINPLTTSVPII